VASWWQQSKRSTSFFGLVLDHPLNKQIPSTRCINIMQHAFVTGCIEYWQTFAKILSRKPYYLSMSAVYVPLAGDFAASVLTALSVPGTPLDPSLAELKARLAAALGVSRQGKCHQTFH
jgi:hypothetical protein